MTQDLSRTRSQERATTGGPLRRIFGRRRLHPTVRTAALASVATTFLVCTPLTTGLAQERYRRPSDEIVAILDAPVLPDLIASPTGEWVALLERPPMLSLHEIAQPRLHLAGYRINPRTNGPSAGGRPLVQAIEMVNLSTGERYAVDLDAAVRHAAMAPGVKAGAVASRSNGAWTSIGDAVTSRPATNGAGGSRPAVRTAHHRWAPDGSALSFSVISDDGYELWVLQAGERSPRRLGAGLLNAASGDPCAWMPDSRGLLCRFVPADRGDPPERPVVMPGPRIQVADGQVAPVRTFQDLLQDEHDADLFDYYFTSQLTFVDVARGATTPIGEPAIIDRFDPAPGGEFIYVVRTVRPYSYIVPDRWRTNDWFPREMEIWDRSGRMVRKLASLPLEENVAVDDFRSGPRGVMWQPGEAAALVWAEDVEGRVPDARDRVFRLPHPDAEVETVLDLADRFAEMQWTPDGRGIITEIDRFPRRAASWMRSWLVDPSRRAEPRLIVDRSAEIRYGAPGTPVAAGGTLIAAGDWIYLQGDGASPEGERPFLDRFNLVTGETERLWQSAPDRYEEAVVLVGGGVDRLIIRSESPVDPTNYYLVDRRAGRMTALTALGDPAPQLRRAERRVLTYERDDGVRLAGVIYTPPDWDGETRLPLVIWAYPREFVSPAAAAQVPAAGNRFTRLSGASHMFFLLEGYAVFDGPSIAILGGATANDTYIEQLVSSAEAAVRAAVEAGIADPDRVGVGGHSYGGFMTANLLAHSDIFRAGIARSAAHNRTLTPFGFQNERRTLWEAPDVYIRMSPFMHADQIDAPLLLIHGADDANPGTFPVQSERMFHALKGHGKVARLVMLNHEDHGYAARESVLHAVAEMIDWFDEHVKGRGTAKADPVPESRATP